MCPTHESQPAANDDFGIVANDDEPMSDSTRHGWGHEIGTMLSLSELEATILEHQNSVFDILGNWFFGNCRTPNADSLHDGCTCVLGSWIAATEDLDDDPEVFVEHVTALVLAALVELSGAVRPHVRKVDELMKEAAKASMSLFSPFDE